MKNEETTNAIFFDDEDDDEDEEEEFMKSYREKRISEMMQKKEEKDEKEEKNNNFRNNEYVMMHVSHEQWTKEVTLISHSNPVLVLLTNKENSKACYPLERVMEDVAREYRTSRTKFRRAEARDIIPNYPERNVPTLILYRNGDVVENIVGIEQFGGMNGVNTETVRRRVRMKSDEFLMDRGEEEAKEAEKRFERKSWRKTDEEE